MTADRGEPIGFTAQWFALGIVSEALIDQMRVEWNTGDDFNPEHYRNRAFQEFLDARRPLEPDLAVALYELGAADRDLAMGGAMMADILRLPECPENVLNAALKSDRKHLVRIVERRRTKQELRPES
jgi:hypothetical protein